MSRGVREGLPWPIPGRAGGCFGAGGAGRRRAAGGAGRGAGGRPAGRGGAPAGGRRAGGRRGRRARLTRGGRAAPERTSGVMGRGRRRGTSSTGVQLGFWSRIHPGDVFETTIGEGALKTDGRPAPSGPAGSVQRGRVNLRPDGHRTRTDATRHGPAPPDTDRRHQTRTDATRHGPAPPDTDRRHQTRTGPAGAGNADTDRRHRGAGPPNTARAVTRQRGIAPDRRPSSPQGSGSYFGLEYIQVMYSRPQSPGGGRSRRPERTLSLFRTLRTLGQRPARLSGGSWRNPPGVKN
jgi:hypothetical protein